MNKANGLPVNTCKDCAKQIWDESTRCRSCAAVAVNKARRKTYSAALIKARGRKPIVRDLTMPRHVQYAKLEANHWGVPLADVLGASQKYEATAARNSVYAKLHAEGFSYRRIGQWFNRDASGVRQRVKYINQRKSDHST